MVGYQDTYHIEGVLNGSLVVHGAEEVFTERQDHKLLEEAITEHELLGGTGDVTVVVEDAHTCETGNLDLEGDVGAEIDVDLGLLGRVGTDVVGSVEHSVEALVSNLINHCVFDKLLIINKLITNQFESNGQFNQQVETNSR